MLGVDGRLGPLALVESGFVSGVFGQPQSAFVPDQRRFASVALVPDAVTLAVVETIGDRRVFLGRSLRLGPPGTPPDAARHHHRQAAHHGEPEEHADQQGTQIHADVTEVAELATPPYASRPIANAPRTEATKTLARAATNGNG